MRFNTWLTRFCMAVDVRCVFSTNELRNAWKAGKTPEEVAKSNDAMYAEYREVYGDDADEVAA